MYSLEEKKEILIKFLSFSLDTSDEIFDFFALLPRAQYIKGNKKQERFIYIPGTRADKVLLVAHADTVWDFSYTGKKVEQQIKNESQIIMGTNPECGIGADDRAGCAMLYALKDCGHSLLIMDSEEYYKHSHNFLKKKHKKLYNELNHHQYMIEVDLMKSGLYSSHPAIANTESFEKYIEVSLNLKSTPLVNKLGTDITQLCKNICGVNISCGYENQHTPKEIINIDKWYEALCNLEDFLEKPQKRFKNNCIKRIKYHTVNYIKRIKKAIARRIKK